MYFGSLPLFLQRINFVQLIFLFLNCLRTLFIPLAFWTSNVTGQQAAGAICPLVLVLWSLPPCLHGRWLCKALAFCPALGVPMTCWITASAVLAPQPASEIHTLFSLCAFHFCKDDTMSRGLGPEDQEDFSAK